MTERDAGVSGVGLGLRWEFVDRLIDELPPLPFVEVSPENYLGRGGYFAYALARVREHYPIVSHGLALSLAGDDPFDRAHLDGLRSFLRENGCAYHSDHLSFGSVRGVALHDLLPPLFSQAEAKRIAGRIREVQDRLGVPVAVENISYYLPPTAEEMSEADFIREVLDASGAKLLLDLNNAWVNAENFGGDLEAFLASLPLDRVVQMHVAGPEPVALEEGGATRTLLLDTHGSAVREPVLRALAKVLRKIGRVPVVLERDENVPPMRILLDEAKALQEIYDAELDTSQPRVREPATRGDERRRA